MGPIYLPSDVFYESSLAPPIPPPLFFSGGGQFVLCGGSQFILGSTGLRGDWRVIFF
jgi:hypothetical protein